jgi:hypothetical protein
MRHPTTMVNTERALKPSTPPVGEVLSMTPAFTMMLADITKRVKKQISNATAL